MPKDFFCRLCAATIDNYVNVFDEEGKHLNLADKIKQCLQIWLTPEDSLPKTVCHDCCNKIEDYFNYYNLCSRSQTSLMKIFHVKLEGTTCLEELWAEPIQNPPLSNYRDSSSTEKDSLDEQIRDDEDINQSDKGLNSGISRRKLCTPLKQPLLDDNEQGFSQDDSLDAREKSEEISCKRLSFSDSRSDQEDIFEEKTLPKPAKKLFEGYVWECTECHQELFSLSSFKAHYVEVHNQPPIFKCMTCPKEYERYRSFANHVKLHGDPKLYGCNICGKRFSRKTVLQSHSAVHSEDRPHVCSQCGKAFKQFSSLYLHSKCHLPDQAKPKFPCSLCTKVFSSKHSMNTHMKIHTGERNFICDICGKSFTAKGSLDYHILTHNENKLHSCPVCGKRVKTARLLAKHSTLHTGVKPHQCDVCGKQFRERSALKEHYRIHTGAMPYSCEYCGKLFRFKGILTIHKRQHTGERPYNCGECRREFTNWANYNKHMKRRHKEDQQSVSRAQPTITTESPNLQQLNNVEPLPEPEFQEPNGAALCKSLPESDMYRVPCFNSNIQMGSMAYYVHTMNPMHNA